MQTRTCTKRRRVPLHENLFETPDADAKVAFGTHVSTSPVPKISRLPAPSGAAQVFVTFAWERAESLNSKNVLEAGLMNLISRSVLRAGQLMATAPQRWAQTRPTPTHLAPSADQNVHFGASLDSPARFSSSPCRGVERLAIAKLNKRSQGSSWSPLYFPVSLSPRLPQNVVPPNKFLHNGNHLSSPPSAHPVAHSIPALCRRRIT